MKELKQIDVASLRSALELYLKEMIASNQCTELANYYSNLLDEETGVKGIGYDEKIPTSSINLTPYQNELILLQASCEQESNNHLQKANEIRKMYHFDDRLKMLHKRDRKLIVDVYFLGITQKEIAEKKEKSTKTISEYLSYAIKHMTEVDI